jgi:outer membrane protein
VVFKRCKSILVIAAMLLLAASFSPVYAQQDGSPTVTAEKTELTLDQCLQMALTNAVNLAQAEYEKSSASADKLAGWGAFLPKLTVTGNFNRSWGVSSTSSYGQWDQYITTPEVSNQYRFTSTLTIPLVSPAVWFNMLASRANSKSADLNYQIEREKLAVSLNQAYFAVLKAEKLLSSAEDAHQAAVRHLDLAQRLFELKGVSQVDVLTAQTSEAEAQVALISARNAWEEAKMSLCYLIGLPVDTDIALEDISNTSLVIPEYQKCLDTALTQRKEILSLEKELASANYSKWTAISAKLPSLSGVGSYYWSDDTLDFGDWGKNDGYGIGLQVSLNLFDGLSSEASIAKARAAKKLAEITQKQSDESISLEVRKAYLSAQEASERMEVAKQALDQASSELDLAERRYELSAGSIIELTDAQATYTKANANYINAVYDFQVAEMELRKAMGTLQLP